MKQPLLTKNFTLLLLGQLFSLIANYTLKFALSMYVLETTGSAEIFGTILAVAVVPTVLLSPLGGVLADRIDRRTLMAGLDAISGVAVACGIVFLRGGNGLAVVTVLQVFLGILGALESPTVQACVPQLQSGKNLLRANALVNQIQAAAGLITPFVGSVLYTAFGLVPVMAVVAGCFFLTAGLECGIVLPAQIKNPRQNPMQIIREDLRQSMYFLMRKQPVVFSLLLLAAIMNFFASGCITVGLPFLVRTTLGLSATWYGAAESVLALAVLVGGGLVTFFPERFPFQRMHWLLALFGGSLLPVAIVLLAQRESTLCYGVLIAAMAVSEIGCSIFSVQGMCAIQWRTPASLTGKIMAFVMTISQCAQPVGQVLYGVLWDRFPAGGVLAATCLMILVVTYRSRTIFVVKEESSL